MDFHRCEFCDVIKVGLVGSHYMTQKCDIGHVREDGEVVKCGGSYKPIKISVSEITIQDAD
jgi:hypothetical protein